MNTGKINNIVIFKPGAIGDLLHLTPVIRELKGKFPDAKISLMVGSALSVDIFRNNPLVHEVIIFNKNGEHRSLSAFTDLWTRLRSCHFDLILNFQRSNIKGWLLLASAFPCRILVYHKTRSKVVHAVRDHLKTVESLGIFSNGDELDLYLADEQRSYAAALFESHGLDKKTVIALNPGASHPVNRWSTAQFAALADKISSELNAAVIIVGGGGDSALAQDIERLSNSGPLVLTGTTTLLQLGAVLEKSALLISGDTGPMHMATAVRTPVVALFGAADPERTGPVGADNRVIQAGDLVCVPCRSRICKAKRQMECMERITPQMVFETVKEMLGQGKTCVS